MTETKTRVRYVSRCEAMSVEERFVTNGNNVRTSIGWYIRVSESSAVYVGNEKPDIVKGDKLRHILEKE